MPRLLFENATLLCGEYMEKGLLSVDGEKISGIWLQKEIDSGNAIPPSAEGYERIDLGGKVLMAGGIDAHVHFREPGMSAKGDFFSESRAALLGGITTVLDMPNTNPPTVSGEALEAKTDLAEGKFWTGYGFHIGATNTNADEIIRIVNEAPRSFAGIKVFMGSSTGDMLVDSASALGKLFRIKGKRILVHCEDEATIRENLAKAREEYGDGIPFSMHPLIRSRKACIRSTAKALETAIAEGTALHILHVSTAEEVEMIRAAKIHNKEITAETSANYLTFSEEDYGRLESRVKCNPAIKSPRDREALREAVRDGIIDTIGSDHAPHLASEKDAVYTKAPSGVPSIQHSIPAVLSVFKEEGISLTRAASLFSEKAASMFGMDDRGFLKVGMRADLTVVDPDKPFIVRKEDFAYKCGWSPYEGMELSSPVEMVFLGGEKAVENGKVILRSPTGKPVIFH